jgi:transcriptional regulator with XRE-family HTH domain
MLPASRPCKKLGLTQEEAGVIIGGGKRAFQKYESGRTPPSDAAVGLIEILARHPEEVATAIIPHGAPKAMTPDTRSSGRPRLAASASSAAFATPQLDGLDVSFAKPPVPPRSPERCSPA